MKPGFTAVRWLLALACAGAGACTRVQPPLADAGPETLRAPAGRVLRLDGSGSSDPQGRALAFAWSFAEVPPGSSAAFDDPARRTPSFVPDVAGSYVVRLVVHNGKLPSAPDLVTLDASCGLGEPSAAIVAAPEAAAVGLAVRLRAEVTDPDAADACALEQTLRWSWSLVAQPVGSGATLSDPAAAEPWFVPDAPGDYVVAVEVGDSGGAASRAVRTVQVGACGARAPVVDEVRAEPAAPVLGRPLRLVAAVTDPDAAPPCGSGQMGPLLYRWEILALAPGSHAGLSDPRASSPQFTPDTAGTYRFRVTVTDAVGLSGSAVLEFSAGPCGGQPPEVTSASASPAAPAVGQPVSLRATIDDPDNGAACAAGQTAAPEWQIVRLPAGSRARLSDPRAEQPWFGADVRGTYAVSVVPVDSTGLRGAPALVEVVTSDCGDAPPVVTALDATPPAPATGEPVQLAAAVEDADLLPGCAAAQTLSYAWSFVELPAGSRALVAPPAGFMPAFTPDVPGRYVVRLTVSDGTGRAGSRDLTLDARTCGSQPPSVSIAPAAPAPNTGDTLRLTAVADDADRAAGCGLPEPLAYRWRMLELPAGSRAAPAGTDSPTVQLTTDTPGTYALEVTVTDPAGHAARAQVAFDAAACGSRAPSAVVNAPANGRPGVAIALGATVTDPDTACLTERFVYAWSITERPAGSAASLVAAAAADPTFTPDAPGRYTVQVEVRDALGHAGVGEAILDVSDCGAARPAAAIAAPAATSTGAQVTVAGSALDADNAPGCALGQSFAFRWTLERAPTGSSARLSPADGRDAAFTADLPGDYELRLVVTDSTGRVSLPAAATVTAAACGSRAPTPGALAVSPVPVRSGDRVTVTPAPSDPDNAPGCDAGQTVAMSYRFLEVPAGSSAELSPASAPSFLADVAGTYRVEATATDSTGRSANAEASIAASACGSAAPVVALGADTTAAPGARVQLNATVTDADTLCGDALAYQLRWSFLEIPAGSAATLDAATESDPFFTPDVLGDYVATVVATDATGRASAPARQRVTVAGCGFGAPRIDAMAASPSSPSARTAVRLSAAAADPDNEGACTSGQPLRYAWQIAALPAGSGARIDDPAASAPQVFLDAVGGYLFRLTVTDPTGRAATRDLAVSAGACGANAPGAVASGAPLSPLVGGTVSLSAAVSDADQGVCHASDYAYLWWMEAMPSGSAARIGNPALATSSFTADRPGTYSFAVRVTDPLGLSTTARGSVLAQSCGGNRPVAQLCVANITGDICGANVTASVDSCRRVFLDGRNSFDTDLTPTAQGGCGLDGALDYRWELLSVPRGSTVQLSRSDIINPSFVPDVAGDYLARLWVDDGALVSDPPALATVTSPGSFTGFTVNQPGGQFVNMILRPGTDTPAIAFYDNAQKQLVFTQCTSACDTAFPSWQTFVADDGNHGSKHDVGQWAAALWRPNKEKGYGAVYHDVDECGMLWIRFVGSSGNFVPVDVPACAGGANAGTHASLVRRTAVAADDDPVASYHRTEGGGATGRLMYGVCANCYTNGAIWKTWEVADADGTGADRGTHTSVALRATASELPAIAYRSATGRLKLASCTANCFNTAGAAPTWNFQDVGGGVQDPQYVNLRIGTDNRPHLSWYKGTTGDLKYTTCPAALVPLVDNCYTALGLWTTTDVDTAGDVGAFNSLALTPASLPNPNLPRISYHVSGSGLRYAKFEPATSSWTTRNADTCGNTGLYTSLQLSPVSGFARIGYYAADDDALKYVAFSF